MKKIVLSLLCLCLAIVQIVQAEEMVESPSTDSGKVENTGLVNTQTDSANTGLVNTHTDSVSPGGADTQLDSESTLAANSPKETHEIEHAFAGLWIVIHRNPTRTYKAYELRLSPSGTQSEFIGRVETSDYTTWAKGDIKAIFQTNPNGASVKWMITQSKASQIQFAFDSEGNLVGRPEPKSTLIMMRPVNFAKTQLSAISRKYSNSGILSSGDQDFNQGDNKSIYNSKNFGFKFGIFLGQIYYSGLSSKYFSENFITIFSGSVIFKRFVATANLFGHTEMEVNSQLALGERNLNPGQIISVTINQFMVGPKISPNKYVLIIPQLGISISSLEQQDYYYGTTINPIYGYIAGYTVSITPFSGRAKHFCFDLSAHYVDTDFNEINSSTDLDKGTINYLAGVAYQF